MDLRWALCGVVSVALMVTGSNAQLDVCGVPQPNSKVVGGGNAAVGTWPWHALLLFNSYFICSGSLVNDQFVLTAAQCVYGIERSNLTVLLGAVTLDNPSSNWNFQNVSSIINHPLYHPDRLGHDIALLKLSAPVTFNNYIRPVCLAQSGSKYETGSCWVTGFGYIKADTPLPSPRNLQEVEVPIVAYSECKNIYTNIPDNIVCAGRGGKGICMGDGGSPLVSKTKENKWVQGGLGSFVSKGGCAMPDIPDGYTEVSQYESWIKSHTLTNPPGFILGEPTSGGTTAVSTLSLPLLLLLLLLSSIFSGAV